MSPVGLLDRRFGVSAAGSTLGRETLGGFTTFLSMAYIAVVNPVFLAAAGMPREDAILATILSAAFATILMGVAANLPVALAPGMGSTRFSPTRSAASTKSPGKPASARCIQSRLRRS